MADTIAAIATGSGVTAIGIIRISGAAAIDAADSIFRSKSGIKMSEVVDRKLIYGELLGRDGCVIDICLCTVSRKPNSYTGEDTAEFHCHGSPVVLAEALRALMSSGVRQAQAGEFTKRAFLNGLLDLSQAEAVIDLIEAETESASRNAAGQLGGVLGKKIEEIYGALLHLSAHFFAVIDYPDEDIEAFELKDYKNTLAQAETALCTLLSTYNRGRIMKDGVKTAIIGRPNVGKSSLLNALLGYERAIVTEHAGTTRDTIEEKIRLGSLVLRLVDTAGIREAEDTAEKLGVARARDAAESAELVLAVFAGSETLTSEDEAVLKIAQAGINKIAVINKSDLETKADVSAVEKELGTASCLSSLTGTGLDALISRIEQLFEDGKHIPSGEILTNMRQADAVRRSLESLRLAQEALSSGVTPDAVLTEIETALSSLGEITGRTAREDIVSQIFERFCVGK